MTYIGIAPLTMARTAVGGYVNILAGDVAPEGLDEADRERLLAEGFLGEITLAVPEVEPDPEPDVDPAEPAEPDDELDIDATIAGVMDWVGDDPARAGEALEAENAKGDGARETLVKKLQALVGKQD